MATSALYYSDAPVGAFLSIPMTARNSDWIKGALQAAVELEISAIPSYLCAYWSIKNPIEESSMARCQPMPSGTPRTAIPGVVDVQADSRENGNRIPRSCDTSSVQRADHDATTDYRTRIVLRPGDITTI